MSTKGYPRADEPPCIEFIRFLYTLHTATPWFVLSDEDEKPPTKRNNGAGHAALANVIDLSDSGRSDAL